MSCFSFNHLATLTLFSILSRYFVLISIDQGCNSGPFFQYCENIFYSIYIDQGGNFGSERWREGGEGTKEEGATKGEKGEEGEKEGKVKKESY